MVSNITSKLTRGFKFIEFENILSTLDSLLSTLYNCGESGILPVSKSGGWAACKVDTDTLALNGVDKLLRLRLRQTIYFICMLNPQPVKLRSQC